MPDEGLVVQLDEIRRSLSARTAVAVGVATLAALVFLELTGEVLDGRVTPADIAISQWIHTWSSPAVDTLMHAFTRIGSYFFVGCVVACVALWATSHGAKALAGELVAVSLAAVALNAVLKNTFERPRPDLFPDAVLPETWSFPSGHSMLSLAAYGTVALVISRIHPRLRPAAWVTVATVVPLVGVSRVYIGVHWPSDVAAGYAAAAVLLITTRLAVSRLRPAPAS